MTFNGPPRTSEPVPASVETPEYWKENLQFVYPKQLFETQYAFAKIMSERKNIPLTEAVQNYAALLNKAIRTEDEAKALLPGLTDETLLDVGYATVLERRKLYEQAGLPYHNPEEARFGCFYYRYAPETKTIALHFFNAEAEEAWEDGKDVSKGPLSKEKIERRKAELTQMFRDISARHPEAENVSVTSNLCNLDAFMRLFPDSFIVGDIDRDPSLWQGMTDIWGQFLGGNEKQAGEYGFKQELADEFMDKARTVPLDRIEDALPMPPRTARGKIEDFYALYGLDASLNERSLGER